MKPSPETPAQSVLGLAANSLGISQHPFGVALVSETQWQSRSGGRRIADTDPLERHFVIDHFVTALDYEND